MSKEMGIIRFKSARFKYSFKISFYDAAKILEYISYLDDASPSSQRQRDDKGKFLPAEELTH